MADFPWEQVEPSSPEGTLEGTLQSAAILGLLEHRDVDDVSVVNVRGRRRGRKRAREEWYSVSARFAVEVEGQTRGMQTVEERVVLLVARDQAQARARFAGYARRDGAPYLNSDGELVRWNLVEVLDVGPAMLDELDPAGTEVYSRLHQRRLTPERAWVPSRGARG